MGGGQGFYTTICSRSPFLDLDIEFPDGQRLIGFEQQVLGRSKWIHAALEYNWFLAIRRVLQIGSLISGFKGLWNPFGIVAPVWARHYPKLRAGGVQRMGNRIIRLIVTPKTELLELRHPLEYRYQSWTGLQPICNQNAQIRQPCKWLELFCRDDTINDNPPKRLDFSHRREDILAHCVVAVDIYGLEATRRSELAKTNGALGPKSNKTDVRKFWQSSQWLKRSRLNSATIQKELIDVAGPR